MLLSDGSQGILAFVETDVPARRYEYAVMVTDLKHELLTLAQLYRDRADVGPGLLRMIWRAVGFRRWQWR